MAVATTTETHGGIDMTGNRRWFGWIGIGLGALALLVALFGRGFGPQGAAVGMTGANVSPFSAPQGDGSQAAGPQNGAPAPGANAQQGAGPRNSGGAPGAYAQQGQAGPGRGPLNGPAGADARRGPGRPGAGGFGFGGWLGFPFKLLGGLAQTVMLALLVLFGVWLLRGRGAAPQRTVPAHGPVQEPLSPTGESYTDEPGDQA